MEEEKRNIIIQLLRKEMHTVDELCNLSGLPKKEVVSIVQNLLKTRKIQVVKTSFDVIKQESINFYLVKHRTSMQKRRKISSKRKRRSREKKKEKLFNILWEAYLGVTQRKEIPKRRYINIVKHSGGHGRRPYSVLYGISQFEGQDRLHSSELKKLRRYGTLRRRKKIR